MNANEARGFLDYILAHPDEDGPRLVFADWLDEHSDSDRAEFIRVQIERERLPVWDARFVGLRLRERALLERHGQKWKGELPIIEGIAWGEFRRGFVATACVAHISVLRQQAAACWAAAPIEAAEVQSWPLPHEAVDRMAPIAGMRELSIYGRVYEEDAVDRLADAPLLSTLRVLLIQDGILGGDDFRRLVASPHLGNLKALRVPDNFIGNGGVRALCDAVSLTSLEELDLSEINSFQRYSEDPVIEAVGMEALAAWPRLSRLRSLNLSNNAIGQDGLRVLLRSPYAVGLKELILRGNRLDDQAMEEFVFAHSELQLDVLDLGDNVLRDRGAAKLTRAPCLHQLKALVLDRCEIEFAGARGLVNARFLGSLRQLTVSHNIFGPEGLHELLAAEPPHLHTLWMINTDVGDEGLSHLAESPASDVLLELNLAQNDVGDHGVRALATSKHLQNLLVLQLNSNPVSKEAVAALADSPLGKRLSVLESGPYLYDDEIPF